MHSLMFLKEIAFQIDFCVTHKQEHMYWCPSYWIGMKSLRFHRKDKIKAAADLQSS